MTENMSFGRGVMANTCGSLDTSRILLTTHVASLSVICGVDVYPDLSFRRCLNGGSVVWYPGIEGRK